MKCIWWHRIGRRSLYWYSVNHIFKNICAKCFCIFVLSHLRITSLFTCEISVKYELHRSTSVHFLWDKRSRGVTIVKFGMNSAVPCDQMRRVSTRGQNVVSAGACSRTVSTLHRPRLPGSSQTAADVWPARHWRCVDIVLCRHVRTGGDTSTIHWHHPPSAPPNNTSTHCELESTRTAANDVLAVSDIDRRRLAPRITQYTENSWRPRQKIN